MKATQIVHDMGQSTWFDRVSIPPAQKTESHLPVTDSEKIADALRAGPGRTPDVDAPITQTANARAWIDPHMKRSRT